MLFYKVVEIKQSSLARGTMSAQDLERAINQWAHIGWTLDRIEAGETARLMGAGAKEVFLLILRRDVTVPDNLYLMVDGAQVGAVSIYQFMQLKQQQKITPATLAIRQGLTEWQPLGAVAPELAEVLAG